MAVVPAYVVCAGMGGLDSHDPLHEMQGWREDVRLWQNGGQQAHVRVELDVSLMMLSLAAQEHEGSLSDAELCTCTAGGISPGGDQVWMHMHIWNERYALPMWAKSWAAFRAGQHASECCKHLALHLCNDPGSGSMHQHGHTVVDGLVHAG